jgi:hypothetical protein
MALSWLAVAILGVWRVTHLLVAEDGPWNAIASIRDLARRKIPMKLLDCFYCLSWWVSLPFAFVLEKTWLERALAWPALSAGAILIEIAAAKLSQPPPAPYFEELPLPEDKDVMLRK